MGKPVIGIMGNTYTTQPGMFECMERAYQNSYYVDAVMGNGGIPVILPASAILRDTEAVMGICDGFLFPGGEDMTPSYYGEEPLPVIQVFRPEIDEALLKAGRYALEREKPVLGICKGCQLLNVLMGGTLYQDLSLMGTDHIQHLQKWRRDYLTHQVEVKEGTRLSSLLGAGGVMTNSMHHQAVKDLGKGLKVSATARDGVVEAIEDEAGLILAVQWHPESLLDCAPAMNRLFSDLCGRAAAASAGCTGQAVFEEF